MFVDMTLEEVERFLEVWRAEENKEKNISAKKNFFVKLKDFFRKH